MKIKERLERNVGMKIGRNTWSIIKNIIYSVSSNFFTMMVTAAVTLIVPKFLGVEDYAYWQLYLFYASYSGYFHFGWNDGFLLRNSGKNYDDMDKENIYSQIVVQTIFMFLMTTAIFVLKLYLKPKIEGFIFFAFCLNIFIINIRYLLLCVYQCSSRFKEFAAVNISDRLLFIITIIAFWIAGMQNHFGLILADLSGKTVSLLLAFYGLKDLANVKIVFSTKIFLDIWDNIKVGVKLMLSSLSNMLILGITRFKIEAFWDLIVFGKRSLCISIINLFITFINAIGIIFFQLLFKINKEALGKFYEMIRILLAAFLAGMLLMYFPAYILLSKWLPQYADSLGYMVYLFPMCLFESKMLLLDASFLKLERLENHLLNINIVSVLLSIVLSIISIDYYHNITLALLSITCISFIRCALAESFLQKRFKQKIVRDCMEEGFLSICFVVTAVSFDAFWGMGIYMTIYGVFLFFNQKKLKQSFAVMNINM